MIDLQYEGDLTDEASLAAALRAGGLGNTPARDKAALLARAAAALDSADEVDRLHAVFVPGRIEVLGKHTDYAGGRTMVAAADRGFCMVYRRRDTAEVTMIDVARGDGADMIAFDMEADLVPRAGHWSNYPMTAARRIARNFPEAQLGADIAFASDLSPAAGMSSSSALIVATFLALAEINALRESKAYRANIRGTTDLAGYLGTVENGQTFGTLRGDRGVGTFGGSEDHTAILAAQRGRISQYRYCPVQFERSIRMPSGYVFAIATSGVVAEKTGSAMDRYNAASGRASALVDLWHKHVGRAEPHLAAIVASSPDAPMKLLQALQTASTGDFTRDDLAARLEHFLTENERVVPKAGDALEQADLLEFGRLVDQSQQAAEELLGNQIPQTAALARAARKCGAAAASAFGAGFGGSVWAMVETDQIEGFLDDWNRRYQSEFPEEAGRASFFQTEAGPAAMRIC